MVKKILIVEDDSDLQAYLKELLLENEYHVQAASDGVEAIHMVEKMNPDLIILDLVLPKMSGEAVCTEIRKKHPDIRIIILTGKDSKADVVAGLELGADDYITKPFVTDELLTRIKARLRYRASGEAVYQVSDLEVNTRTIEVKRDGKLIRLTPQEFKLLEYLIANKGRILTRDMILNRIWLYSPDIESRVVDVYMGYLRKKIDKGFKRPLIHSARGFGYMIKE